VSVAGTPHPRGSAAPTSAAAPALADALARFVFERGAVRGVVVSLDRTSADILACHPYPPALRRVLGELLGATALLASTLKFQGSLTVQLQGDGPVRLLVVECDATLTLRATAQWDPAVLLPDNAPLATLAGGPEHGRLAILLDPRDGGPVYQGIVALEATTIAALMEHYLSTSEQIASRLALATAGDRVRGILLQRLPASTATDDALWERVSATAASATGAMLFAHAGAAELVSSLFAQDDVRLFSPRGARFGCSCSPERVENALRLIGRQEVESILQEQGGVTLHCEFCNREYRFAPDAARGLFAEERDVRSSRAQPH
jgi:molecular chaperone Hsp33